MFDGAVPTFDVHQHLWPEQLLSALARRRRPPRLAGSVLELERQGSFEVDLRKYGLDARLRDLDRDEIDAAVVSLAPSLEIEELPEDEAEPLIAAYHEGILEAAAKSRGRIRPLAAGRVLAGGGPFQVERLRSRGFEVRPALLPNVYLETASYGRRALELCLSTFGVRQLLYGSDAPIVDTARTLRDVRAFGQAVADALCRD